MIITYHCYRSMCFGFWSVDVGKTDCSWSRQCGVQTVTSFPGISAEKSDGLMLDEFNEGAINEILFLTPTFLGMDTYARSQRLHFRV